MLPKATNDPKLIKRFYNELSTAVDVPSMVEILVLGDFNAKIDKRNADDEINGLAQFIGKYGVGTHNGNGEHLLNFVGSNGLIVTNTSFKHASRHITTHKLDG